MQLILINEWNYYFDFYHAFLLNREWKRKDVESEREGMCAWYYIYIYEKIGR